MRNVHQWCRSLCFVFCFGFLEPPPELETPIRIRTQKRRRCWSPALWRMSREETCLPPSPVPHPAFADLAVSVFAYLPSRRLVTLRLGGGFAQFLKSFMWPCSPCSQAPLFSCSPASCRAFSCSGLSCCDCRVCARMGCCVSVVEDVVKVSGPSVLLFDVLAFVDAFGALFTAAAVLGFCLLEHGCL